LIFGQTMIEVTKMLRLKVWAVRQNVPDPFVVDLISPLSKHLKTKSTHYLLWL
jgi:hypothetical protein